MHPQTPPFAPGWLSVSLGSVRPCDGTYCFFDPATLPPIPSDDALRDLAWLAPLHADLDQQMALYRSDAEHRARMATNLTHIIKQAQEVGVTLPPEFVRFMGDPALQDRFPSCTACEFDLPTQIVPALGNPNGFVIRFLNDQQDVLLWHLYLARDGTTGVLVSAYRLDELDAPHDTERAQATHEDIQARARTATNTCAPSFIAFLYRFWLENTLWYALENGTTLTPAQQRYLNHYAQANNP
jgi:hypothetical protein